MDLGDGRDIHFVLAGFLVNVPLSAFLGMNEPEVSVNCSLPHAKTCVTLVFALP
jgi:hypothetical protein